MLRYIINRFLQMVVVFFLFLIISYLLFDAIPGNAFQNLLLNPSLPPYAYEETIALYGLDQPLSVRLQKYIVNFFKGDLGYSYIQFPKTAIELIAERLPRTLMLFSVVNILAFYTGFFVGKVLAWRRGSRSETWITITSVFSYTVFYPWLALLMLWLFLEMIKYMVIFSLIYFVISLITKEIESLTQRRNIRLGSFFGLIVISNFYWNAGVLSDMRFYAGDIAYHTILPVVTVTVVAFAGTALLTRTTMMEVLKDDYILTARAKGLSQKRIRDRHAARTALLPVVTSFIFTIVTIIDGSVLTETIFSWPGMGQLILDSVLREDIPVAMATFSFIGVFALIAHFLADVSYAFLDPRIRIKSQG